MTKSILGRTNHKLVIVEWQRTDGNHSLTSRPLLVTQAARGLAWKRECANPRQPYMLLAVSLRAFCRMSSWTRCSGEVADLSMALTCRLLSTRTRISVGKMPTRTHRQTDKQTHTHSKSRTAMFETSIYRNALRGLFIGQCAHGVRKVVAMETGRGQTWRN